MKRAGEFISNLGRIFFYLNDGCRGGGGGGAVQERVTFLEAREALLWLNESEPSPGWAVSIDGA